MSCWWRARCYSAKTTMQPVEETAPTARASVRPPDTVVRRMPLSTTRLMMSSLFLSPWFIPTLRLVVATVLGSLFTLLGPVAPTYCFTAVFVIWIQTQLCVEDSVGTALNAVSLILGALWVGAISAGALSSLAMLAEAGAARTAVLCCLGVAGLVPFAIIRVGPDPASLNGQGNMGTVLFGLSLILGQFASSHAALWQTFIGGTLQAVCAACAACIVATLLILPSLASEKVPAMVTSLIRDTAAAISSGSPLLAPSAPAAAATMTRTAGSAATVSAAATAAAAAAATEATVAIETSAAQEAEGTAVVKGTPVAAGTPVMEMTPLPCSTPAVPGTPVSAGNPAERASSSVSLHFEDAHEVHDSYIRLLMAATRPTNMIPIDPLKSDDDVEDATALVQARWGAMRVGGLRQRLAAAQALLPAASVEPPWLTWTCSCVGARRPPRFRADAWHRLLAATGVLVSRVASLECVLEEGQTLHRSCSVIAAACHAAFALSAATVAKLSLELEAWQSGQHRGGEAKRFGDTSGGDWMAAKAAMQDAFQREIGEYWQRVQAASKAQPFVVKGARPTTALMFLGTLAVGMMAAAEELEAAVNNVMEDMPAAAEASDGSAEGTFARASRVLAEALDYLFGWLARLIPLVIWSEPMKHLMLMNSQLSAISSRAGIRQLLGQRYVQAGLKFWLACSVSLVVVMVLAELFPIVAGNMPVFGFIATVAAMRERVESTLEKVAARVVGTILGATAAYGVMSSYTLANSPGALVGFLAAACMLLGPWAQGHLRLMVALTVWTFTATVLCQFKGCCGATLGQHSVYIARLVSVAGGVIWTASLNRALLPWRGSAAEIESLAEMVKTSVLIMRAAYDVQYEEARLAPGVHSDSDSDHVLHEHDMDSSQQGSIDDVDPTVNTGIIFRLKQLFSRAAAELSSLSKGMWPAQTEAEQRAAERRLVLDPNGISLALGTTLVKVQKQMEREGVPWKSGLLAVPQIARDMLTECGRLMDALEALQLAAIGKNKCDVTEASTSFAGAAAVGEFSQGVNREDGCTVHRELGPAPCVEQQQQQEQQQVEGTSQHDSRETAGTTQVFQPSAPSERAQAAEATALDVVFVSIIQPLDGLVRTTLEGTEALAALVVGHCRWPSEATRSALEQQIQDLMELRTAVWSALVKSRKQRIKAIRSGMNLRDMRSSFLNRDSGEEAAPRQGIVKSASEPAISPFDGRRSMTSTLAEAAAELRAVQHSETAVKYLAVIFAMYKVNNRLMAVARMVLQYGESDGEKPNGAV